MKAALAAGPSLEVRHRIDELLESLESTRWVGMPLQTWRALAILERIGTDDARQVLAGLAQGDPEARLTQEAKASLDRLRQLNGDDPDRKR